MAWYAAHLIMYVKLKDHRQDRFPVWENIVLIKADSEEEAFATAERRGRADAGDDDGGFRWGDHPAAWVFAGVRKLTLCQDSGKRPGDGTEVSYTEMEVGSVEAIEKLLGGEPVPVRLCEKFNTVIGK